MKLIKYDTFFTDPWSELDRLFENNLPELYDWTPLGRGMRGHRLPMDAYETDSDRVVRLEVPGVKKADVAIELENAVLTVKAKRIESGESGERTIELSRSVTVGDDIETEQISASLEDGVLKIKLPKKEPARTRQITVD
jgi:HSP20 family protein